MRDEIVTRLDVNAIAALRSRIIETINNTQKSGYPPNPEDIFDKVCGFAFQGRFRDRFPLRPMTRGWLYCPMSRLLKTAAEYRAMAEECFKWARETYDGDVRASYLQLGQIWLDAASKIDGLPAAAGPPATDECKKTG